MLLCSAESSVAWGTSQDCSALELLEQLEA
jgi:hypothetical protein